MLRTFFFTLLFTIVSAQLILAQDEGSQNSESHEKIKDPGLELVLSGLIIYTPENGMADLATEIHLTYWVSHTWAFGVGYSQIFEEDGRVGHEIAALASVKPWKFLTTNFGPSFSIASSHHNTELSAYAEGEFNFEIGAFHTGPLFGMLIGEEFRLFSGIHIGYDF